MTDSPKLIWGIKNIATLIGRTEAQTFHMAIKGLIPVKKVGARYVAERGQLIKFFTTPDIPASSKEDAA